MIWKPQYNMNKTQLKKQFLSKGFSEKYLLSLIQVYFDLFPRYEDKFDLHGNEHTGRTMISFARRLVTTQRRKARRKWPIDTSSTKLERNQSCPESESIADHAPAILTANQSLCIQSSQTKLNVVITLS